MLTMTLHKLYGISNTLNVKINISYRLVALSDGGGMEHWTKRKLYAWVY